MDIKLELDDDDARRELADLVKRSLNLSPLTSRISVMLESITNTAFEREQDPTTGQPWAPLSDVTLARRAKAGNVGKDGQAKKLQVKRHLLNSITPDYDRTSAVVSTNIAYATTHQFGARKGQFGTGGYKTKRGTFPIPWGDIPARPFFGLSDTHRRNILDLITRYLLRRRSTRS